VVFLLESHGEKAKHTIKTRKAESLISNALPLFDGGEAVFAGHANQRGSQLTNYVDAIVHLIGVVFGEKVNSH
jgi:hypothetical protein